MTFAEWFEANKKYIYGADVDAWCETAFEAGLAAGLQERAPVDIPPASEHVRYSKKLTAFRAQAASVDMEPVSMRFPAINRRNSDAEIQDWIDSFGPLVFLRSAKQAVAAEREKVRLTGEANIEWMQRGVEQKNRITELEAILRQERDALTDMKAERDHWKQLAEQAAETLTTNRGFHKTRRALLKAQGKDTK